MKSGTKIAPSPSASGRRAPHQPAVPNERPNVLVIDDILGGEGPVSDLALSAFKSLIVDGRANFEFLSGFEEASSAYSLRAVTRDLQTRTADPDLILLDVSFGPEIALGYDVLTWIKQNRPRVPVVMMTSHDRSQNIDDALEAGAIDFIHKPISSRAWFWDTIERYLAPSELRLLGHHPQYLQAVQLAARFAKGTGATLIQGAANTGKRAFAHYVMRLAGHAANAVVVDARDMREVAATPNHPAHLAPALIINHLDVADAREQEALARFLDTQEAAGTRARIVGLSNDYLIGRVKRGVWNLNLYNRLADNVIQVPTLAERAADITFLVRATLNEIAPADARRAQRLPPELDQRLLRAPFEANLADVHAVATTIAKSAPDWDAVQRSLDEVLGVDGTTALSAAATSPSDVTRQQLSDVEVFLSRVASHTEPYKITVDEMHLTVLPGVFSPRYSHSSDFLIRHLEINPSDHVVDVGCGTGVLGLAALKRGAAHATFVDINPEAMNNAQLNINDMQFSERARAAKSDVFDQVEGRFDLILSNPPFWNRRASTLLERSCFDENYAFLRKLICDGAHHIKPKGRIALVMSNQSDLALVHRLLAEAGWRLDNMSLESAKTGRGGSAHIRVVWLASMP